MLTAAGGDVEVVRALDAPDPTAVLCVIHVESTAALPALEALPEHCRVIAVLARADLTAFVDTMQQQRIAAVVSADDPRRLYSLATRLLTGEIFGLEKVMKSGTQIHAHEVHGFGDRAECVAQVTALATRQGVPATYLPAIEQCLDELLMNALYNAPVDTRGRRIFEGVSAKHRGSLHIEQTAELQYAFDGKQFAIAVRDAFGSLERDRLIGVLAKCLHADDKVDRKVGGAGVGLYLIASTATSMSFNVVPGLATEVSCTFDLDREPGLAQLGFVVEPTDVTGRLRSGRLAPDTIPAGVRRRRRSPVRWVVLAAAVAALAVLGGVMLTRRAPAPAVVELDTTPSGARVFVDRQLVGETPLTLTSLPAGTTVAIALELEGYQPATVQVAVPAASERAVVSQPLALSPDFVKVRFVSDPPGARIVDLDAPPDTSRTYAPAELFLPVGKPHRVMFAMPGHIPVTLPTFTPVRGQPLEKRAELVDGVRLQFEASRDGTVSIANAPHCKRVTVPGECTLVPGDYVVEFTGGAVKASRSVHLVEEDVAIRFDLERK